MAKSKSSASELGRIVRICARVIIVEIFIFAIHVNLERLDHSLANYDGQPFVVDLEIEIDTKIILRY